MRWWRRLRSGWTPPGSNELFGEFEDTLMVVVDPEQLTNSLISRLRQVMDAQDVLVYLADSLDSSGGFARMDRQTGAGAIPPLISSTGKTANWFRVNREPLFFEQSMEVMEYLQDETGPFCGHSMNAACPLISMERLVGIVFLRTAGGKIEDGSVMRLKVLIRQAGLAFANALLFKERLRQHERMYRAEQLATMGQFAAGIAHELRNPLTAIRSTVQFLSGEFPENSQQRNLAEGILSEVDRLNEIVGNLLSLAKPSQSRPIDLDLREELDKCVGFVEAKANSQNVSFQVRCDEPLPKLHVDPAELRQVLLNIIANGLQAMPGGGVLSIEAHPLTERFTSGGLDANKVLLEISDQGQGVPPELRSRVFDPFFTTKAGGTGLGLAICRSIARRYNGDIWIEDAPGGGAVVKIVLGSE